MTPAIIAVSIFFVAYSLLISIWVGLAVYDGYLLQDYKRDPSVWYSILAACIAFAVICGLFAASAWFLVKCWSGL